MAAAIASSLHEQRGNILVASSQAAFRKRLMARLSPAALRPVEALGGADALLQLATSPFKTLLLDPLIEDLDVSELVDTVHARYPLMRVVVVEKTETAEQLAIDFLEQESEAAEAEVEAEAEPEKEVIARISAPVSVAVGALVEDLPVATELRGAAGNDWDESADAETVPFGAAGGAAGYGGIDCGADRNREGIGGARDS